MASASDIETVRLNVDEPTNDTYSDDEIGAIVDVNGVAGASAIIWEQKAARFASLVNTTEAGASHSFSDLSKNAREMASLYRAQTTVAVSTTSRTRVRKIERT
jgi:hypothetical protein